MMVQSKIKVKENGENGVATSKRRSSTNEVDHWAFLEEIEAPMWADLSLEPMLMTEDQDDSWFHTSHPFHHHSARHLRSAFAHPDVGNDLFNVNLQGACSPQLPHSVSKSRGKDYRSRGWRRNGGQISSNKAHPINDLGDRISLLNTISSQECKPKASYANRSEVTCSTTSVVDDSDKRIGLNSRPACANGVSTSTITTVSLQQDTKVFELLNEGGHAGSLLHALRTNLRKSCATRPASRVEISDEGELKGQKSSSGKSSVGSSSAGYDTKTKGSEVMVETDQCEQMKIGQKSAVGKSSVGPSSAGYDTDGKGSFVMEETDQCMQVKIGQKYSAGKSSVGFSSAECDTEAKGSEVMTETDQCKLAKIGQKSSAGKSSVGSSNGGYVTEAKGFELMAENDQCEEVKIGKNVSIGPKVLKTSFVRSSSGISNPTFGVKKRTDDSKQSKVINSRDLTILGKPANGRVKDKKMGEASVCARNNAYRSNLKNSDATAARTNAYKSKITDNDAAIKDNSYSSRIKGNDAASTNNSSSSKIKVHDAAATRDDSYSSRIKINDALAKNNSSISKIKGNAAFAAKNNSDGSKIKANAAAVKNNSYSSKIKVNAAAACSRKEALKSKVLLQTTQKNSLNQSKTGIQGAKGSKVGSNSGKENMRVRTVSSQRSWVKDIVPVVRALDHKVPELKSKVKGRVTSLGSKVRAGKVGDGIKTMDTRIHLR